MRGAALAAAALPALCAPPCAALRHYACDAATPYECGQQIGRQAAPQVAAFLRSADLIPAMQRWTEGNATGRAALAALERVNTAAYPHLIDEIRGLAAGSGASYATLLVANLQYELYAMMVGGGLPPVPRGAARAAKGCSDWHAPGAGAWAHNEDGPPLNNATYYFVTQRIASPPSHFFAFTYAGQLAGWAYGMNAGGVAQSINALRPGDVGVGVAQQFVARDVLDAASVDDAVRRAAAPGQAAGQHFNLAALAAPARQVSVETSPLGSSVLDPVPAGFAHANLYLRLNGSVPQPTAAAGNIYFSSAHRVARLSALPPPRSSADLVAGISDRADSAYPVYRSPQTAEDYDGTLTTAVFDAGARSLRVWDSRPSLHPPAKVLGWDDPSSWAP